MSIASEVKTGTIVIVKVGRNMVEAIVTEITETGVKVKSRSSGREFETRRIERIVAEPETEATAQVEPETPETEAATPVEPEAPETEDKEDHAVNPAPESGDGPRPAKKLSLLNAAAQVLATCREPLNCKQIIAKAVEMGLWTPTGAKTPEQTLYSGIFREIKSTDEPRFKKSESRKGSFEYAK